MIIIADAHVSAANGNVASFFEMLAVLEKRTETIVFLGDIFDLWVSLPGYQDRDQDRFLAWCAAQSKDRTVGFVEGNHEFFVAERNPGCFSWCTGEMRLEGELCLVHGDQINQKDKNYLRFRKLTKNRMTKWIVRFLPLGRGMLDKLKKGLKKTNKNFRLALPEQEVDAYAREMFSKGARQILVGHFHQEYRYNDDDGRFLQILPDWFATRRVGLFDGRELVTRHWRELSP